MKFTEIINDEIPVLIDFYADWCGPCKQFSPIIQEVKNEMGEVIRVIKIDVDRNEALARKLDIMSIPTVVIYKKGKLHWRASGVQSKQLLINKINEIAEL
jgi:thioredoxin 1